MTEDFVNRALSDVAFTSFWLDRRDVPLPELPLAGRTDAELLLHPGGVNTPMVHGLVKDQSGIDLSQGEDPKAQRGDAGWIGVMSPRRDHQYAPRACVRRS